MLIFPYSLGEFGESCQSLAYVLAELTSSDRVSVVVEPRWATSSSSPLTVMQGGAGVACPMTWVFLWIIVRLNRSQASENLSISLWSPSCW